MTTADIARDCIGIANLGLPQHSTRAFSTEFDSTTADSNAAVISCASLARRLTQAIHIIGNAIVDTITRVTRQAFGPHGSADGLT